MKWQVYKMIRVLQCVNIMDRAGLETMLMNYYRNIDRTQIQFDFLTHREECGAYDIEIEILGGKLYHAPRLYPQNYPAYFKWMKDFFLEHPEYEIVHSHIDAMSYLPLLAAKKAGVPVRIAHSHNTKIPKDFKFLLKQYFRYRINSVCNYRLACGQEAGKHLFGNKPFDVIPNAIEAEKFYYNEEIRKLKRNELCLKDSFVIGNVGRFSSQKNHKFLIEIFKEILKLKPNSILLLIGEGELRNKIKNQVERSGINSNVRFLGNRSDVYELYQAMDVFVMPSLFEGLPVVGIEAQFAKLPCVFSDKVTREVQFIENCSFVGLDKSATYWAKRIVDIDNIKRMFDNNLFNSKYNIKNSNVLLTKYYLDLMRNINEKNISC